MSTTPFLSDGVPKTDVETQKCGSYHSKSTKTEIQKENPFLGRIGHNPYIHPFPPYTFLLSTHL